MNLRKLKFKLQKYRDKKKAKVLQSFFKTGPGEYAQGDIFLGVTVPILRILAKEYQDLEFNKVLQLLHSKIHEERQLALFIFILKYRQEDLAGKAKIYQAYLKHTKYINNWDLVDLTAALIVGGFLKDKDRAPLYKMAVSDILWERRISILATFNFIKDNDFQTTLKIAKVLISDTQDLIHKAVGWMLREIGKRDRNCEEKFLQQYYKVMPRTMLRYAIEHFPELKRQAYLQGRVLSG